MKRDHNLIGLSNSQISEMRKLYGSNELSEPPKESTWSLFIEKFSDPLIIILLMAMALSLCASVYQFFSGSAGAIVFFEPVGIFVAVMLAIGVGFWFELSANRKFDILSQEDAVQPVKVLRNGNYSSVPRNEIVVNDIVLVDIGDEIPADGILIEAVSMIVNESVLTGEPSIHKTTDSRFFNTDATYPSDRLLRGTTVIDGHGIMKVTMVGEKTEYGKVYKGSRIDNKIKTPLNIQLDNLSSLITKLSYIIAAFIIIGRAIQLWTLFDIESFIHISQFVLDTIMIAVTIIVVAVPEGLPMSVNLSLALSMRRMLAANNLVRKMHACETMGAATVICTDKTGTLTQNKMRVGHTYFPCLDNNSDMPVIDDTSIIAASMSVNSTANLDLSHSDIRTIGNPTESALLAWLWAFKIDYRSIREAAAVIEQSAFSTEKKYMATLVRLNESSSRLYVKGAPEIILDFCNNVLYPKGNMTLTEMIRADIMNHLLDCQSRAMRTIAFAYIDIPASYRCLDDKGLVLLNNLTFIGFVGISDPIRPDVPDAVCECLSAGIKVKIVTGDTPATAREIGRQIGLWTSQDSELNHITGAEFAAMSDEAALKRVEQIKIMSRARPMDKSRLVSLLQQHGEVVAVTGDGTNDAPALKRAQVGLSMGDGTSVAKQASAITILDNSFHSINQAVLWGRSLYRNIQRFIVFQLTINVAACIIVMIGAFLGEESPLTVTQMLWVNLIMDTFAAMALASLPPETDVMADKPRDAKANIISHKMFASFMIVGCLMVALQLALLYLLRNYEVTSFDSLISILQGNGIEGSDISLYESSLFFTIFVMLQFWNLFNAKAFGTSRSALHHIYKCPSFLFILAVILVGQIIIVSLGGQMFNVTPLSTTDWISVIFSTMVVLVIGEFVRLIIWVTTLLKGKK